MMPSILGGTAFLLTLAVLWYRRRVRAADAAAEAEAREFLAILGITQHRPPPDPQGRPWHN